MSRLPKFILVLTTLALVLSTLVVLSSAASAVDSSTIIIGSNDSASRYPIGLEAGVDSSAFPNFQAGGIYQQVYAGSAFAGPTTITQIAFASSAQFGSHPGTATYNFNIALGTTPAVPNGLSTNLAANRGNVLAPVFSGPVVATLTANNQFDVVIDIAPFTYDPAQGNLLLELTMNAPVQFTGGSVLYFTAGSVSSTSRAASPTGAPGGAFTDSFGVRTRFTTNTVGAAQVTLGNLVQTFDGSAKSVSVTTDPAGLNVAVTYDGSSIAPTNAGSYAVTANISEANFNGQANGTLIIQPASQQLSFDPLPNRTAGDADFNVSATASSNLAVSFAASGNCTLIGTQVHLTGLGPCTITASQSGNGNINAAAPVARTFSISKADQQITFDALSNKTVGDPDFGISATASSNLAVAFSAGGNCTVSATQVHITGAGACTITASQDGNANINAATPVARTFSIGKADQQITFEALSNKTVGDADFNVSATASSNLAVAFSAGGNCTMLGSQVHLTGAGPCTITASQDGDANINPATPVARTFSIGKANQQITFDALANKTVGDADFGVSATASSNLAVVFSAAGNCTVLGSQVHLSGAGACTITASQDGDANINPATPVGRTFSIGKANQQITFDALANRTVGDADFGVSATASSHLAVAFSAGGNCTVSGAQVHLTGAGLCTITAGQDGDANINAASPVARTFSIGKAAQQITFDALSNKTVGDPDFNVSATASSNLAVSFAASGVCTLNGNQVHVTGAGLCTITASQDGDANINAAIPVGHTFSIGKSEQQISFDALADKKFGDTDFIVNATASSGLAVGLAANGNCTLTGNQAHLNGAGSCTITATQDGNANTNAAAPVVRTFAIGKADQQITFDALADKKFGDADFGVSATASSNLTVSFAATGNCTVSGNQVHLTGAGPCTITASQAGDANVNAAAPVSRTFSAGKSDQQITFEALADKKFGDADFAVSATASSNLAVSLSAVGNCTVTGTQVHLTEVGPCTITASQAGDANINVAAPVARTFSIGKADQQITFDALADKKFGDADVNVSATASSNLAVAFSASGNCTLAGGQVHLTGAGSCTITATQDGNASINAAAPVARTFSIAKTDQQVTFEALADKKLGDADFNVGATASSSLAVTFAASGVCTLNGNQVRLTGAGSCTITASQDGNANINAAAPVARTFAIAKADQQIAFDALADKKFGDADFSINATASSNLAVSLVATGNCTMSGNQVQLTGAGSCTITASQDGDANSNAAVPVARTFAIKKGDQQITFEALADKKFGDADFNVTATASSNLAVSLAASGNCTLNGNQVHLTGAGSCTITASQNGNSDYNQAVAVSRSLSIGKADQQITFAALADKKFGDADFGINATTSSSLVVSLAVSGNCTLNGNQVHLTGAGSCTITASQEGDVNSNAGAPVARTFAIGKAEQQITFEALADKKFGDVDFGLTATASSNLTVSLAASGDCTLSDNQVHLTSAGACTITASQDGNSDYSQAAVVSRTFAIADQAISQTLISFSSAAYETAESVGALRITVKRSGDTSGSSTVEYATDDSAASVDCEKLNGLARSRCDFNAAIGTLTFAPGEIEKTFDVLINRDSRVEPTESFTVLLSNPTGGATLSTPASATVQIIDRSGGVPANTNVIDDTRTFVRQQYHDFLNREPDAAGLAFWVDNIDKCNDPARRPADLTVAQCTGVMRVNTSAAFFLSVEFSQSGGLVHAFYAAALDRPNRLPGYLEFIRDTEAVGRGVIVGEGNWQQTLNDNREAFMKDFVTRPEFVGLYPTVESPDVYVNRLYLHALGRQATANELDAGVGEFGGSSAADDPGARARALLRVTQASDFSGEVNRSFVLMQYIGYLRRNANDLPDSNFDGYDFWLNKLNSFNGNFVAAEMVKAFLVSGEYRARFGP